MLAERELTFDFNGHIFVLIKKPLCFSFLLLTVPFDLDKTLPSMQPHRHTVISVQSHLFHLYFLLRKVFKSSHAIFQKVLLCVHSCTLLETAKCKQSSSVATLQLCSSL